MEHAPPVITSNGITFTKSSRLTVIYKRNRKID